MEEKREEEKEQWYNCSACGKKTHITTMNVIEGKGKTLILCDGCYKGVRSPLEKETKNPNMMGAVLIGIVAAIVGALIWFGFVVATGILWGLISVVIGYLVGKSVVWGSGNKRGVKLQLLSFSLTCLSLFFGEYLIFSWYIHDIYGVFWIPVNAFILLYKEYLSTSPRAFLDFLFFGIALWIAITVPRARKI